MKNSQEQDNFIRIQEIVFEYCDKLTSNELITIIDGFVFNKIRNTLIDSFLNEMDGLSSYINHLSDIEKNPYFLKCSGSDLQHLELLNRALFLYSYNKYRELCKK